MIFLATKASQMSELSSHGYVVGQLPQVRNRCGPVARRVSYLHSCRYCKKSPTCYIIYLANVVMLLSADLARLSTGIGSLRTHPRGESIDLRQTRRLAHPLNRLFDSHDPDVAFG